MFKILITNANIVTMSQKLDLVIRGGYIYIEDGIIKSVDKGEPPPEYEFADYVIDAKGKTVVPGMCIGYLDPNTDPDKTYKD